MHYNASRNVSQSGGLRKAKRVSDVNALGAPSAAPSYPAGAPYNPGFAGAPPPYTEGVNIENNPGFGTAAPSGDFSGFMPGFHQPPQAPIMSPTQMTSMLQSPVVQDMALQYGNQLASVGKEAVQREFNKFVPVSRLRYYFAVDTRYVIKKLMLIIFPFAHKDWMLKYDADSPVQPRYDLNAPDLYIPTMGYVTYVLLAGFMLGIQDKFSPEQIGIQASSALAYIIFEMLLYLVTLYITNTNTNLKYLDLLAFSGYKYIVMINSLIGGLLINKTVYYCMIVYYSFALSYFLVKTLRVQVLSGAQAPEASYNYNTGYTANPYTDNWSKPSGGGGGTKRRLYFLLFVAVIQPLLSWWLTYHLVPAVNVLDSNVLPAR